MELKIAAYESWMLPQVAAMFSAQYGVPADEFALLVQKFYEHPFQATKCIRVVALDGEKVAGFQSFFYWPYERNGKVFNSFQSGNSLVHPDYRGKGLFQKLLDYVEVHREELNIDFLMGFPVEESYKSFIRNKWENPFDLHWFIRLVNPFSFLFGKPERKLAKRFSPESFAAGFTHEDSFIRLHASPAFAEWRKSYATGNYYQHTFREGKNEARFSMKLNRRKKILTELIIGDVQSSTYEAEFLSKAFSDLKRRTRCVTFLSIAVNSNSKATSTDFLRSCGFKPITKKIYFIIKPFKEIDGIRDNTNWLVFRSDIDTW
jgi:hypothetical protein